MAKRGRPSKADQAKRAEYAASASIIRGLEAKLRTANNRISEYEAALHGWRSRYNELSTEHDKRTGEENILKEQIKIQEDYIAILKAIILEAMRRD